MVMFCEQNCCFAWPESQTKLDKFSVRRELCTFRTIFADIVKCIRFGSIKSVSRVRRSAQFEFRHRNRNTESERSWKKNKKMATAQSEFGKVKLISLEIVDFKKLEKGKVAWNYSPDGHFGTISVQSFVGKIFFQWIFIFIGSSNAMKNRNYL